MKLLTKPPSLEEWKATVRCSDCYAWLQIDAKDVSYSKQPISIIWDVYGTVLCFTCCHCNEQHSVPDALLPSPKLQAEIKARMENSQ